MPFDVEAFAEDKRRSGLVHAIKLHFPGYAADVQRTHEERQRLIEARRRFISYVQKVEDLSFSEAESIVDGRGQL